MFNLFFKENPMDKNHDPLKIANQLCFPLYAASREVIKAYKPFLEELDLTYTQYIAMMVLWEKKSVIVKKMGEILYLDSGTLTPLLKKMESKGLLTRTRSAEDERNLVVAVTEDGMALRKKALGIPDKIRACSGLTNDEARALYPILMKLLKMNDSE